MRKFRTEEEARDYEDAKDTFRQDCYSDRDIDVIQPVIREIERRIELLNQKIKIAIEAGFSFEAFIYENSKKQLIELDLFIDNLL